MSHCRGSPESKPRLNHFERCALEPCVKLSGFTVPGLDWEIGGYRIPNAALGDNGGLRLGVGISSPILLLVGAAADCTPIPSTLEFVTDYDARTGIHTSAIHYGFQF